MRKRQFICRVLIMTLILGVWLTTSNVKAVEDIDAESAILVDGDTGDILYSRHADLKLPPASMTKMMTEYLVLEAISEGQIDWETTVQISDYPYSISANPAFSGIGLRQNQDYTVRELYEGMAIISDNAATIALAELVAGSESDFVRMMNEKGEEMGLTDFKFVNSTGLNNRSLGDNYPEGTEPEEDNLMSARASAMLAFHLVNDYPEVLEFSSMISSELDGQPLENLNWMLEWNNTNFAPYYFEGMDGLKTGFTTEAGYAFTGTATQDGKRLISVVMRTASYGARFEETKKLMEYGFGNFTEIELFQTGDAIEGIETLNVTQGKEETVAIAINDSIHHMVKNGEEDLYRIAYQLDDDLLDEEGALQAPVVSGTVIGQAYLTYEGDTFGNIDRTKDDKVVDLIATQDVEKANWFALTLNAIGDFFTNIYQGVVDTVNGWF